MPNINPKVPGDLFYPQYSNIVTRTANEDVKKGSLYTVMREATGVHTNTISNGRLVSFGSDSQQVGKIGTNFGNFFNGIFQPLENSKAGKDIQCFTNGSYVGLKASAGIGIDDILQWDATNEIAKLTEPHHRDINSPHKEVTKNIGRVTEIYTKDQLGEPKPLTDTNDIVVVELYRCP